MSGISQYMSRKISHVKMICALLVIYIHMYDAGMHTFENLYYEQWFEDWFSQGFCRIAVPLFFFISGYLAFSSRDESVTFPYLVRRLPRKLMRLVVPFLAWNFLYYIWQIALDFAFAGCWYPCKDRSWR